MSILNFNDLPQAVSQLKEQVAEIKEMVSALQPAKSSNEHILVDIDEACRIIHKAKPTIYALIRKGIIPAYKRGKRLYFYKDELLKWIEEGRKCRSSQTYEEMSASIQQGIRRKPKSGLGKGGIE